MKIYMNKEKVSNNSHSFLIYWKHKFSHTVDEIKNFSIQKYPLTPFSITIAELDTMSIYCLIFVCICLQCEFGLLLVMQTMPAKKLKKLSSSCFSIITQCEVIAYIQLGWY